MRDIKSYIGTLATQRWLSYIINCNNYISDSYYMWMSTFQADIYKVCILVPWYAKNATLHIHADIKSLSIMDANEQWDTR